MRVSKKTVEPLLDEYARLSVRKLECERKRDLELAPFKETYEKKVAPIVTAAKERTDAIDQRLKVLLGDITAQLMSGVDEKAETVAISQVTCELEVTKAVAAAIAKRNKAEAEEVRTSENGRPLLTALAEVQVKEGDREIEAQKFFEFVKESERSAGFWASLKVLIAPAEKFLGDKIKQLAKRPKKYSVSVSIKT